MKAIKQKKQVLDNSMIEDEFFEDAMLIGIVCPLPSYQFVWRINKAFNYMFERTHEFEVEVKNEFYEVYCFAEDEKLIEHTIYVNRKNTHFLLDEIKHIDFIWMIKGGALPQEYTTQLPTYLNEVNAVVHSFILNPQQLKSKHLLIL
jgi:hypothetical protein